MEVPALTFANLVPLQVGGGRAPAPTQKPSADVATPSNQSRQSATHEATARPDEGKLVAEQRKTEEQRPTETTASDAPASVGRIRFELDEGTRIAKFFDTKDVLIYQVPPEGKIYLVRAQETAAQDQIETSA